MIVKNKLAAYKNALDNKLYQCCANSYCEFSQTNEGKIVNEGWRCKIKKARYFSKSDCKACADFTLITAYSLEPLEVLVLRVNESNSRNR